MADLKHVVVEGAIGVGKSILARKLAETWGFQLIKEDPDANPFLPKFYRNLSQCALETQLSFLLQRRQCATQLEQLLSLDQAVVSDFMFEKDGLFASVNLENESLELYNQIAKYMIPSTKVPDLVIYLEASQDILLQRVAKRGKEYEEFFPQGYLARIYEAYSRFFYDYDKSPLLIVNTDHLDFVEFEEDYQLLLRCISDMKGRRSYFNKSV